MYYNVLNFKLFTNDRDLVMKCSSPMHKVVESNPSPCKTNSIESVTWYRSTKHSVDKK